jgi:hypothetical protein
MIAIYFLLFGPRIVEARLALLCANDLMSNIVAVRDGLLALDAVVALGGGDLAIEIGNSNNLVLGEFVGD